MFVCWNNSSSYPYRNSNLERNWNIQEYSSFFMFLEFLESRVKMSSSKTNKTGKGYAKIRVTEIKALWLQQKLFHGLCDRAASTRPSNYYFTERAKLFSFNR